MVKAAISVVGQVGVGGVGGGWGVGGPPLTGENRINNCGRL